jgi:hypothetical protein
MIVLRGISIAISLFVYALAEAESSGAPSSNFEGGPNNKQFAIAGYRETQSKEGISSTMIYPHLKQYHQEGFDGAGVSIAILDTGISQQYLATVIN